MNDWYYVVTLTKYEDLSDGSRSEIEMERHVLKRENGSMEYNAASYFDDLLEKIVDGLGYPLMCIIFDWPKQYAITGTVNNVHYKICLEEHSS